MKFLHTSDLHLGRSLSGYSLAEAQQAALNQIVAIAAEKLVDAVLIAGDVYDRAVPPPDSVAMFENFLGQLRGLGIEVVVISGNHDQPIRLGYGSDLFNDGLHVFTNPERVDQPVALRDAHGEVLVYGIPYLDPELMRRRFSEPQADAPLPATHEAVLGAAMQRIRADLKVRSSQARVVVVAHAFVVGGQESTSERDVAVGGVPSAPSAVFDGAHYVALGHLHGPQQPASIATEAVLRYSGSPLRYSISERNHIKSVTIVDLDAMGKVEVELVPIDQERPMAELRGSLAEVLAAENQVHRQSWVKVVITDELAPDNWRAILREHFPYFLEIEHESSGAHRAVGMVQVDRNSNPIDIAGKFIANVRSSPVSDDEQAILDDVIASIRRAEVQA